MLISTLKKCYTFTDQKIIKLFHLHFLKHEIVPCSFKYLRKACHAISRLTLTHHLKRIHSNFKLYTS